MESRAKALGHPIHPMLVVFPLGLLITSVLIDIVFYSTNNPRFPFVALVMIVGGIIGGLLAAVFGLIDMLALPEGTRARRIALLHGGGNVLVLLLFTASAGMRFISPDYVPAGAAFALSLAGLALGGVTAWLGGELVDRLAVGVDPGAHLDSPSSLSGEPASADARREADMPTAAR